MNFEFQSMLVLENVNLRKKAASKYPITYELKALAMLTILNLKSFI